MEVEEMKGRATMEPVKRRKKKLMEDGRIRVRLEEDDE